MNSELYGRDLDGSGETVRRCVDAVSNRLAASRQHLLQARELLQGSDLEHEFVREAVRRAECAAELKRFATRGRLGASDDADEGDGVPRWMAALEAARKGLRELRATLSQDEQRAICDDLIAYDERTAGQVRELLDRSGPPELAAALQRTHRTLRTWTTKLRRIHHAA